MPIPGWSGASDGAERWSIVYLRFFFALGVLNAFAADAKKVVGLGEACDAVAGIVCKSGLECNAPKSDVAGVCAASSTPTSDEGVPLRKPTDGE